MKKIIVPVDFSPAASNAATFAGELAAFYGAEIWLYHTYETPVAISEFAYPLFDISELQKAAENELALLKEKTQGSLRTSVNIHTRAKMALLQDGLTELCDELNPDLVVMGISGKGALTQLLIGSNTIKAVHYLKYPVLVVPLKATFTPVRKIGFACDYREIKSTAPVPLLKKIVKDFNADLHILNIDFQNKNFTANEVHESFILQELIDDIKPEYHSITSEDVTEGINWFADKAKLDWIVVIPKKHPVVQKIFSRSHTRHLLFHTHLPILCLHQ
jgi:nucleotide-binding universal stress UspA family protein